MIFVSQNVRQTESFDRSLVVIPISAISCRNDSEDTTEFDRCQMTRYLEIRVDLLFDSVDRVSRPQRHTATYHSDHEPTTHVRFRLEQLIVSNLTHNIADKGRAHHLSWSKCPSFSSPSDLAHLRGRTSAWCVLNGYRLTTQGQLEPWQILPSRGMIITSELRSCSLVFVMPGSAFRSIPKISTSSTI